MTTTTTNEQLYSEGRYDELFERNTDFIWYIHKRYHNIYIDHEEYYSLCCLAFTKALKGFDPKVAKFVSYWGTVINREMLNYLKAYKKKEEYGIEIVSLDNDSKDLNYHELVADPKNVIDEFLDSFDSDIIKGCIKKLTPRQMQVYNLYLQGFTHKDIADKLNVSRQAVGKAIKNGKDTLRHELSIVGVYA